MKRTQNHQSPTTHWFLVAHRKVPITCIFPGHISAKQLCPPLNWKIFLLPDKLSPQLVAFLVWRWKVFSVFWSTKPSNNSRGLIYSSFYDFYLFLETPWNLKPCSGFFCIPLGTWHHTKHTAGAQHIFPGKRRKTVLLSHLSCITLLTRGPAYHCLSLQGLWLLWSPSISSERDRLRPEPAISSPSFHSETKSPSCLLWNKAKPTILQCCEEKESQWGAVKL